ncbi:MAG: hypothetical protein ACJAQT_004204 [Akkermansiaceae bacterium]|jgi:hypothetical protein
MAALIPEWIVEYENIVEVSSFRHLYIAPTKRAWKAQHIQSGVITKVLKGNLKVGTRRPLKSNSPKQSKGFQTLWSVDIPIRCGT